MTISNSRPSFPQGSDASGRSRRPALRLGYVALVDAAPLIVAEADGLFSRYGLNVVLSREVGWATIREKVVFGELDAAHALGTMPFVTSLGMVAPPTPCVSGIVLSRGGNAVVLSDELRKRGVKGQASLKRDVENRKAFRKYKFATVHRYSSHNFLLRSWLADSGISADDDVELVTLPPAQMCRNLAAGTIDGFCAGEPWTSMAISQKYGWSPVNSEDLHPNHPEKVLMVRQDFLDAREDEHSALIAALVEACRICDDRNEHRRIAMLLSERKRVNCEVDLLEKCLSSTFNYGLGRVEERPGFMRFHRNEANRPTHGDVDWVLKQLALHCADAVSVAQLETATRVLRGDLFDAALTLSR